MMTFLSEEDFEDWVAEKLVRIEQTIVLLEQSLKALGENSTKTYSVKEFCRELGIGQVHFRDRKSVV